MKVAICIEIKNENRYIREWLEYHKKLGFDNIILYDNNDSNGEDVFDVIGEDIRSGFVIYENIKDKKNAIMSVWKNITMILIGFYFWIVMSF